MSYLCNIEFDKEKRERQRESVGVSVCGLRQAGRKTRVQRYVLRLFAPELTHLRCAHQHMVTGFVNCNFMYIRDAVLSKRLCTQPFRGILDYFTTLQFSTDRPERGKTKAISRQCGSEAICLICVCRYRSVCVWDSTSLLIMNQNLEILFGNCHPSNIEVDLPIKDKRKNATQKKTMLQR